MKLIGMLDSPYVRRVAICLKILKVPFEHRSVSVFSTYAEFQTINPVVKAPTLVLEDGRVMMDSSLILQYVDPASLLWPAEPVARARAFRLTGLALAACEKRCRWCTSTTCARRKTARALAGTGAKPACGCVD